MPKAFLMQIIEILAAQQTLALRLDYLKDLDLALTLIGYVRTVPDTDAQTITYIIDAEKGETISDSDHEDILIAIHYDLLARGYSDGILLSYARTDTYMMLSFTPPEHAHPVGAN